MKLELNFNKKINDFKLYRAWLNRNVEHGELMMESLEIDYIFFQQSLFVEDDAKLSEKLSRIGFKPLVGFPDEKLFEDFSRIMYNRKHNIAISLYNPKDKLAIKTAIAIVNQSLVESDTAMAVFLSAVNVLRTTNKTNEKQILLG